MPITPKRGPYSMPKHMVSMEMTPEVEAKLRAEGKLSSIIEGEI
ncbi:hypothetical protein V5279_23505 [Bradyrhizobium sp. 26S5]